MKLAEVLVLSCLALAGATSWAQIAQPAPQAPAPRVAASAPLQPAPTRGRLLYETHCIACHNSQMHWRDGRIVRDWTGLVEQVRRWQERARLQWSEADILEVARHLNSTIYRLAPPGRA
ncbi:MAG: cytochrome C [Rubrivivax sp.]|nr:cytochrome C [Rubrivivax sp.]